MADLRNIRPRPGVRINLHVADIAEILTQPDVLAAFSDEELFWAAERLEQERQRRRDGALTASVGRTE